MAGKTLVFIKMKDGDALAVYPDHPDTSLDFGRYLTFGSTIKRDEVIIVRVYGTKIVERNGPGNYYPSIYGHCWVNVQDISYACPFEFPNRGGL